MPDAERKLIFAEFVPVNVPRHRIIQRAGTLAEHYWYVQSGFLRSYAHNPEGADVTTDLLCEGDVVIDYASCFLRQAGRENIETLSACKLWQIALPRFEHLFHALPAFREVARAQLVTGYFALKRHTLSLITDPAAERYARLAREKAALLQGVPLKYIASWLGITDTSLSCIRRELALAAQRRTSAQRRT